MFKSQGWRAVLLAAVVLVCAAAPHYHITRPQLRCSIPDRDYQHKEYSESVIAVSYAAFPMRIPAAAPPRWAGGGGGLDEYGLKSVEPPDCDDFPEPLQIPAGVLAPGDQRIAIKLFQFRDPRLRRDHCSISEMAVQLHESGHWIVSLRADQNPVRVDPLDIVLNVTTIEEPQKFTANQLRNKFHVELRCYGAGRTGDGNQLLGKPVMIPLDLKPFMVQRGKPYPLFKVNYSPAVREFFDVIDHVEIEFYYELAEHEEARP